MIDDIIAGIPRPRWHRFRVWLSDLIHPDSRILNRCLPEQPVARELATLVYLNGDRMSERDQRELLADVRRRLGVRPLKGLAPTCFGD